MNSIMLVSTREVAYAMAKGNFRQKPIKRMQHT